jgi:hypothetical protein
MINLLPFVNGKVKQNKLPVRNTKGTRMTRMLRMQWINIEGAWHYWVIILDKIDFILVR